MFYTKSILCQMYGIIVLETSLCTSFYQISHCQFPYAKSEQVYNSFHARKRSYLENYETRTTTFIYCAFSSISLYFDNQLLSLLFKCLGEYMMMKWKRSK